MIWSNSYVSGIVLTLTWNCAGQRPRDGDEHAQHLLNSARPAWDSTPRGCLPASVRILCRHQVPPGTHTAKFTVLLLRGYGLLTQDWDRIMIAGRGFSHCCKISKFWHFPSFHLRRRVEWVSQDWLCALKSTPTDDRLWFIHSSFCCISNFPDKRNHYKPQFYRLLICTVKSENPPLYSPHRN